MPYIWERNNEKVAVTIEDLVTEFFNTWDTLKKNIYRHRNYAYGIKKLQSGGNGRRMLIDYDTLPIDIRECLVDPRKVNHQLQRWYHTDAETRDFFSNFRFENGKSLEMDFQERYIINASVLKAVDALKDAHVAEVIRKGKKAKHLYRFMSAEVNSFRHAMVQVYGTTHTLPESERAFRRVYDPFRQSQGDFQYNYRAVISGKHLTANAKSRTTKEEEILDSLFSKAGSKPSKKMIGERYRAFLRGEATVTNLDTGELYNPEDFNELSHRSISLYLSSWESRIATNKLRSADRQRNMGLYSIHHHFEMPKFAGAIISIDDREPPFEYGPSKRIKMYNFQDVGSRCITVSVFSRKKDEALLMDGYRQMIRNYTEWGVNLPYELEAEMHLNSGYQDSFLQPGVLFERVHLEANNARGKFIERTNRDLRYIFEKEKEGWKGRPHARDESNQAMPGDGMYDKKKYRTYDDLVDQSLRVIEEYNNSPHPDDESKTKFQYFLENQHKDLRPTNWKLVLRPPICYVTQSSCRVGVIQLQGEGRWLGNNGKIAIGNELIQYMKEIEGRKVEVYWLDDNHGDVLKAHIYYENRFICELLPVPKYNRAYLERTDADAENEAIQSQYKLTVDKYMKDRKNSIERVVYEEKEKETTGVQFKMPGRREGNPDNGYGELEEPWTPPMGNGNGNVNVETHGRVSLQETLETTEYDDDDNNDEEDDIRRALLDW